MKILHEDLVVLLADALGSDKEEASQKLSEWVDAVVKEIEENGSFHAEGMGIFRMEAGKLQFEPDEKLSMEVNHKFAGMSPIEVSPPQSQKPEVSTPEESVTDEDDAEDHESEESDAEDREPADSDQEDAAEADADSAGKKGLGEEEDPFDLGDAEEHEVPWTPDDEEGVEEGFEAWDDADSTGSLKPEDEEEESFEELDKEVEKDDQEDDRDKAYKPGEIRPLVVSNRSGSDSRKYHSKKGRSQSALSDKLIWIVPVAALIIAAILLFFHFDGLRMDRSHSEGPAVVQEQVPVTVPDEEEEENGVVHEIAPSPDPIGEIPRETEDEPPLDPVQDAVSAYDPGSDLVLPYGLKGPEDEVLIGAYTIVLHSVRNERKSEIEKKRLEDQGFKATRWSAEQRGGGTTWRIGVGQFKNVSDAEQAVEELPEPYRSNNFIIRIR